MLIIHDNGKIIATMSGTFDAPAAIVAEIPDGFAVTGVNENGELILSVRPKTQEEQLETLKKAASITAAGFTDEQAAKVPDLYPAWEPAEAVQPGDRRSWGGKLYKAVQAHTTQANWTPDAVPALWAEVVA